MRHTVRIVTTRRHHRATLRDPAARSLSDRGPRRGCAIFEGRIVRALAPNSQLPTPNSQLPTPNSQLPTPNSRTTPMDDPRRHPLPVRADLAANTLFNRRATPVDAQNPGGELCAPTHERPDFALPSPSSAVLSLNLPTTAAAPNRHFKQCRRGLSQFCGVFGAKWDGPSPQEW